MMMPLLSLCVPAREYVKAVVGEGEQQRSSARVWGRSHSAVPKELANLSVVPNSCSHDCSPSISVRVDNAHVTLSPGIVTEQSVAIVKDYLGKAVRKAKIVRYR